MMTVIEQVVRNIAGAVFANVSYDIPAKDYIRKKATDGSNAINPLWDRKADIRIEKEDVQINLGVVYENAINGRLVRKEIAPNFDADKMNGKVAHSNPHKLLCQKADRSKTYLCYMPMKKKVGRFILDGQDVTETLKPFMAKKSEGSKKQKEAGLEREEQVEWRTLDLANIRTLKVLGAEITQG